jgi:glycyl-tRNA synthetase beta chain
VIDACLELGGGDDLAFIVARARALQDVLGTEDGENLVQGFKRANNILRQAEEKDGVEYSFGADPKFAEDPAETALFDALKVAEGKIAEAVKVEDFTAAMGPWRPCARRLMRFSRPCRSIAKTRCCAATG